MNAPRALALVRAVQALRDSALDFEADASEADKRGDDIDGDEIAERARDLRDVADWLEAL